MNVKHPARARITASRRTFAIVAAGGLVTVASTGVALATISSTGPYTGCVNNSTGALRVIDASAGETCIVSGRKAETEITWNQQGEPGPKGDTGPTGDAGPAGPSDGYFSRQSAAVGVYSYPTPPATVMESAPLMAGNYLISATVQLVGGSGVRNGRCTLGVDGTWLTTQSATVSDNYVFGSYGQVTLLGSASGVREGATVSIVCEAQEGRTLTARDAAIQALRVGTLH